MKPADVAVLDVFKTFPTGDGDSVHPWVADVLTRQNYHEIVEALRARAAAGLTKYGCDLTDWSDDALILHAAQESLDKLHYLGGALMHVKRNPTKVRRLAILHNQLCAEIASAQVLLQLCAEIQP